MLLSVGIVFYMKNDSPSLPLHRCPLKRHQSYFMYIRSTSSQSAIDAPPTPPGAGRSCVSGARVFQHDAGVPRSPT